MRELVGKLLNILEKRCPPHLVKVQPNEKLMLVKVDELPGFDEGELYSREMIDDYKQQIKAGTYEPIRICTGMTSGLEDPIVDGSHRVMAAKELDKKWIKAYVCPYCKGKGLTLKPLSVL